MILYCFLCINIFYIFVTDIHGFLVVLNKVYDVRTSVSGKFHVVGFIDLIHFAKFNWGFGHRCDTFTECDGLIRGQFCMIKYGCADWHHLRLSSLFVTYYKDVYDAWTFKLYDQQYMHCHFYVATATADSDIVYPKMQIGLNFDNVMNIMATYILLLDDDHPYYSSDDYQGQFYFEHQVQHSLETKFGMYTKMRRTISTIYSNYIQMRLLFECPKGYYLPHCIIKCFETDRHYCTDNVKYIEMNSNDTLVSKIIEVCKTGWEYMKIRLIIHSQLEYCNDPRKHFLLKYCIFLDMCKFRNCSLEDQYCMVTGNGTFRCETVVVYYTSNFYPNISHLETNHVAPNETITIHVSNITVGSVTYALFDYSYEPTTTCDIRCVSLRNTGLVFRRNNVTFMVERKYADYNFYVAYVLHIDSEYLLVKKIGNFTYIAPPEAIITTTEFYICAGDHFSVVIDVFPRIHMHYNLWINENLFGSFTTRFLRLSISLWSNSVFRITTYFTPNRYINYTYTREQFYAARPFTQFQWGKVRSRIIYYEDNSIKCNFETVNQFQLTISIFSSIKLFTDSINPIVHFKGFRPGRYKLLCTLVFTVLRQTYNRYKDIYIFQRATKICLIPFGAIRGNVVRCATNHFPYINGSIYMIILDETTKVIIEESDSYYIKIPYLMKQNYIYTISCYFKHFDYTKNTSTEISIHFPLKFLDATYAFQSVDKYDCERFAPMPQEYLLLSNEPGALIFYVDNFYLTAVKYVNDIYLIVGIFCFLFLPFITMSINLVIKSVSIERKQSLVTNYVKRLWHHRVICVINRAIFFQLTKHDFIIQTRRPSNADLMERAAKILGNAFEVDYARNSIKNPDTLITDAELL